jgi:hypothetical protein
MEIASRFTRAVYAFVVLFAPALAMYLLVTAWQGYFMALANPLPWFDRAPPYYTTAVALAGFLLPGFRAWARVLRGGDLIPAVRLRERPIEAAMVALACVFAIGFAVLVSSVLVDVWAKGGDDVGGPIVFFTALAAMAAAIALLIGELVLVGRYTSAPSPGAPS